MDFFPKTDVPYEIETKIKVKRKAESKHEISKDLLFKNEIKKDFKTKTDYKEMKEFKKSKEFKIKIEPKDEIEDGEFKNGLRVIENLKQGDQMDPETPMLQTFENNKFINEKKIKPEMFKIKIEPKAEIEDGEFQNGLRLIENLKCGVQTKVKNEEIRMDPRSSMLQTF